MVFQVAIAFACGLFEGAAYKDPERGRARAFRHRRLDDAVRPADAECAAEVRDHRDPVRR